MTNQKQEKIKLPHGASIDGDGVIMLPIGDVIIKLSLENWNEFFETIDDINLVIQSNTVESVIQCPTCNTISTYIDYEEPNEEEFN